MDSSFWANSDAKLTNVEFRTKGGIEDCENTIMVDFANMYIGGGCMGHGCVQEEIFFLIYPELLFSLMIFPPMGDHEAIIMTGAKRFSDYKGYAWTTQYGGAFIDNQPRDEFNRIQRVFCAIDALYLGGADQLMEQFTELLVIRELNKAYIGFQGDSKEEEVKGQGSRMPIGTGNWGCGAFNGNHELKFLIQWMAASVNGRDMIYNTFGDKEIDFFASEEKQFYSPLTVGEVWKDIAAHAEHMNTFIDESKYIFITSNIASKKDVKNTFKIDKYMLSKFLKKRYE